MSKIPNRRGTLGWQSMLAVKHELLYQYKLAQKYSNSHIVQVHHGKVAEAVFRQMLGRFLPKRYGVTAGYIISQSLHPNDNGKISHFDVIIYDQLESPILWVEGNPDSTESGANMAIPAEYVVAVLEVKSSFESKTVSDAISKLSELSTIMEKVDDPNERYKKYLPVNFCCGTVFFELRKVHQKSTITLEKMLQGLELRNYMGSLILEAEGLHEDNSARTQFLQSEEPIKSTIEAKGSDLLRMQLYGHPEPHINGKYYGIILKWTPLEFSQFLFDLIAFWNGTFEAGRLSSFHGVSFVNSEVD